MRISNHRYSRDRGRYDLAYGMLQLGARPKTVIEWTQLTQFQIRNIAHEYSELLARSRGRPPNSITWFWREGRRQREGAVLASLLTLTKIVIVDGNEDKHPAWRSVSKGMRLCDVYQEYSRIVPNTRIPFEYLLLLVKELSRGDTVGLRRCTQCAGAMLADPLSTRLQICSSCRQSSVRQPACRRGTGARSTRKRVYREIRQQVALFD